jgi:hypothetical protein
MLPIFKYGGVNAASNNIQGEFDVSRQRQRSQTDRGVSNLDFGSVTPPQNINLVRIPQDAIAINPD